MEKLSKDFFEGEVAVCGCTKADNAYYKRLYENFTKNGVEVFGMPTDPESPLDFTTYASLEEMPHVPKCAYLLCPKTDIPAWLDKLQAAGVKKVLFYNKTYGDAETIADCEKRGMEARVGCPLMLYASGPCYLHAAFSGVSANRRA